jgi:hypothetical protein
LLLLLSSADPAGRNQRLLPLPRSLQVLLLWAVMHVMQKQPIAATSDDLA